MRNKRVIILSICLLAAASSAYAAVVDKIIAVVNSEVITQREIDRILDPVCQQYRMAYQGVELAKKIADARAKVISQLVEDKLILSEARKLGIPADEKEVNSRIDELMKRIGSKERFEKALSQEGLTIKALRERYLEQTMVKRLVDHKVGSKITISPVEINSYYQQHASEFISPERISLSNILIRPKKGEDPKKAYNLANELKRRLKEGCDFSALAKEYSEGPNAAEGGSMGYVQRGDLMPDIEAIVFKMKDGEVSEVIQTGLGYHIFKMDERLDRKIMELQEVRRDIEDAIYREKVNAKLKGWLETLKRNAYISFK